MKSNKVGLSVVVARNTMSHMGQHSGYDYLVNSLKRISEISIIDIWRKEESSFSYFLNLATLLFFRHYFGSRFFTLSYFFANKKVIDLATKKQADIVHLTYFEDNYSDPFCFIRKKKNIKVVATSHQPLSWLKKNVKKMNALNNLDALVVLSPIEKKYFEAFIPDKVYLIPHGVDTDFFKPNPTIKKDFNSCVFSGNWLRDIKLLVEIVKKISLYNPSFKFHIVNHLFNSKKSPLNELVTYENVFFYKNISDETLRDLYCSSGFLLLPLLDSTANNALLEGTACGLPVIASDIGGVRYYTHSTYCEYIEGRNIELFVEQINSLIKNPLLIENRGKLATQFVKSNFDWNVVAKKVVDMYKSI